MPFLNKFTMRHIVFMMLATCLGIFIKGGLIGLLSGLVLGFCIAELTHMIDSMRG